MAGWCYPSVKDSEAINACVKASKKEKFNLESSFLCEVGESGNEIFIGVFTIDDDNVSYHSYDDNPSKVKKAVDNLFSHNIEISKLTCDLKNAQQVTSPQVLTKVLNK